MNYYDKYGKITLSKETILYHWSNKNKILHKYKLVNDINLILTIKNDNITNKQLYSNKNNRQDYELLTSIYNEIVVPNSYGRCGEVCLKMNKTNFPI